MTWDSAKGALQPRDEIDQWDASCWAELSSPQDEKILREGKRWKLQEMNNREVRNVWRSETRLVSFHTSFVFSSATEIHGIITALFISQTFPSSQLQIHSWMIPRNTLIWWRSPLSTGLGPTWICQIPTTIICRHFIQHHWNLVYLGSCSESNKNVYAPSAGWSDRQPSKHAWGKGLTNSVLPCDL